MAGVLALGLGLRLWSIRHGFPYVYDSDERAKHVRVAVEMLEEATWTPARSWTHSPALTYLFYVIFGLSFGGAAGVQDTYTTDPADLFLVGRVVVATLGTVAIWLLYLVGARLFDRRVGLLAADVMAVAFLPVFYSRSALDDVPQLAPLTLSLLGAAGIYLRNRSIDYVLAGGALGFAIATKYVAGIVVVSHNRVGGEEGQEGKGRQEPASEEPILRSHEDRVQHGHRDEQSSHGRLPAPRRTAPAAAATSGTHPSPQVKTQR